MEVEHSGENNGGGGGAIPWNGQGTLTDGKSGLTYINLSTSGTDYQGFKKGLDLLTVNIDDGCLKWLATNLPTTKSFGDYVASLKIGTFEGVVTTSTHNYVLGVGASADDAGFDILFATSTQSGTSGFNVYIHEIAHLLNAPGFQNNDGETNPDGSLTSAAQGKQTNNEQLIQQNCGSTINRH